MSGVAERGVAMAAALRLSAAATAVPESGFALSDAS
jgi:hypothetical protein